MVRFASTLGLAVLLPTAFAQPTPLPKFDIADVHVVPHNEWVKKPQNDMSGGNLIGDRYELRRATMLDLIRTAYSVNADKVYGGPSWLDYDRFTITAKAPPKTPPEALRLMLQSLLADRFGLVIKADSRQVAAYVLTVKDRSKLNPGNSNGEFSCRRDVANGILQCRNATMDRFVSSLTRLGGNTMGGLPVMNSTGLDGVWDLELQLPSGLLQKNGDRIINVDPSAADLIGSLENQLGLILVRTTTPQPVLTIERVTEQPTPNPPGIEVALPPPPPPTFEVASVRPCDGQGGSSGPRFQPGGFYTAHCIPLLSLIRQAWGVEGLDGPIGPKWLQGAPSYSIEAKAPEGIFDPRVGQDKDIINALLRGLIAERFQMTFHYEDRPVEAYTLVANKPKLTKANPSGRAAGCVRQQRPPSGHDQRIVCHNISMAQFGAQLQGYGLGIQYLVLDGTGLAARGETGCFHAAAESI